MNRFINTEYITSVDVFKKAPASCYEYKKEHTRFLLLKRPEGVYRGFEYITDDECKAKGNLYVEDEKVYYKPHIEINYGSNYRYCTKWFETIDELTEYMKKMQIDVRLIEVK